MRVSELMTTGVRTCRAEDTLNTVARDMWDGDCGCVPVIDAAGRPIAMVTDRDICMAAFLTGQPLHTIPVKSAASQSMYTVAQSDSIEAASALMRDKKIRRLAVTDEGGQLVGVLSAADLVRTAASKDKSNGIDEKRLTWTLSGITEPWHLPVRLPPIAEA